MLTKNEISTLNLSPTKKDFVQIWNELLDVAGKLSERWDPTSTNESDPGIVILKALTGIADKLNYNIDKNTLEAFMPSAAQEDSMRKLCEMLGYNIKYYRSAVTNATIKYHNTDPEEEEYNAISAGLLIPKFTVLVNNNDISYFTTESRMISLNQAATVRCLEGQIIKCTGANENNVITINQISEDNRYYLPETEVAENGIFVYNIYYNSNINQGDTSVSDGEAWTQVDNLNTQARGQKVFKFGFDSYGSRPYLEFPEDYSDLFGEGIFIYYTRTRGVDGNISAHTLTQLELPNLAGWDKVSADSFSVDNTVSATSGANIETISQAYRNFKKTVGTFNTLVTCRDYMNYIYNMIDNSGKSVVSNVLVTDLRNDINRAITICSCDDSGILYKEKAQIEAEMPLVHNEETFDGPINETIKPVFNQVGDSEDSSLNSWHLCSIDGPVLGTNFIQPGNGYAIKDFRLNVGGAVAPKDGFWAITQTTRSGKVVEFLTNIPCVTEKRTVITDTYSTPKPKINHFDLVIYPFKSYTQINSSSNIKDIRSVYDDSFGFLSKGNLNALVGEFANVDNSELVDKKTIAHNFIAPASGDLISINNYLRLNATIGTTTKVTDDEKTDIVDSIKKALANAFNMRELDFGEEIPFENIVEVMEKADHRIKFISLNEPALYTTFSIFGGYDRLGRPKITEYAVASDVMTVAEAETLERFNKDKNSSFNTLEAKQWYNKLIVRNILAGRVPLFKYNKTFTSDFYEMPYQVTSASTSRFPDCPEGLKQQEESSYNIYMDESGNIFTSRIANPEAIIPKATHEKIEAPLKENGNIIEYDTDGNKVTDIQTFNNITTDNTGTITDLTLGEGEYVRFRAPNFITTKTYPAYVNYHLQLAQEGGTGTTANAVTASAETLYDIVNASDTNRQAVLDYFGELDAAAGRTGKENALKKTFTISQKISKYTPAASTGEDLCTGAGNEGNEHVKDEATGKCKYCGKKVYSAVQKGPITATIKGEADNLLDKINSYFIKSGFIKLLNEGFTAKLAWDTSDGDTAPSGSVPLTIKLDFEDDSQFITDADVITKIQAAVDSVIEQSRGKVKSNSDQTPILPTACAWTVSFEFECVPFDPVSLYEWEKFIRYCAKAEKAEYRNFLGFKPAEERGSIFWRVYGSAYDPGKYILDSREKLLRFEKNFDLLPANNYQQGIYLARSLGADAVPKAISNDKEYQLKTNEYLFIEYTPSTTTEDGTQQEQPPKKEILGPGTIIKPSGFTSGLINSEDFGKSNTSPKNVSFELNGSSIEKPMFRFAANEQVEVREYSKVTLSKDTLSSSETGIWVYKNFNGRTELEEAPDAVDGSTPTRRYTLKDGEYIFYTDSLKTDFAYFGSGTEVILTGNVEIPECDIVDIATIRDNGVSEVQWQYVSLYDSENSITFQEYQYITLGPKDTIKSLTITGTSDDGVLVLNDTWTACDKDTVTTYQAYEAENPTNLPSIDVTGHDGWEVSSVLELSASPSESQTLRYVPKYEPVDENDKRPRTTYSVDTGLILTNLHAAGDGSTEVVVSPKLLAGSDENDTTLKFKANVACNVGSTQINITDLYTNSSEVNSFKLKVFSAAEPAIVKTLPGKVVPNDSKVPLLDWHGESLPRKDYLDLWHEVSLEQINVAKEGQPYDNALVLPVLTMPNTYGIVCFYVNYTTGEVADKNTWIEVIPGTSHSDVEILNVENNWETARRTSGLSDRLNLRPGINCVRFKRSGRFFVKSTSEQGIIYFDDLRLVNCDTLRFKDANGLETTVLTKGLNLDQLGYISTAETEAKIDDKTLLELSKGLVTDFATKANEVAGIEQAVYNSRAKALIDATEQIEKMQSDLTAFNSLTDADKNTLIDKCNTLRETLKLEDELLEVVQDKTADTQLISFISQFATKETTQEQLTTMLEDIKQSVNENITGLAPGKAVVSFKKSLSSSDTAVKEAAQRALIKTKTELLHRVHNNFIKELDSFVVNLSSIISSEDFSQIKDSLDSLQKTFVEDQNSELLVLLNSLQLSTNLDEAYSILDEMITAKDAESYSQVVLLADRLENLITSQETQTVLSELEKALSNNNTDLAKTLITKIGVYDAKITDITTKITDVRDAAAVASPVKATVTSKINTLTTNVTKNYKDRLKVISNLIEDLLDATSDSDAVLELQDFIDSLSTSSDTRILELLEDIREVKTDYESVRNSIKEISATTPWSTINSAVYAKDFKLAIAPIWSEYLLEVVARKFSVIEADLLIAIAAEDDIIDDLLKDTNTSNGISTLKGIRNSLTGYFSTFSTDAKALKQDQLEALVDAIETMCNTIKKNEDLADTAKSIGNILGFNVDTTVKTNISNLQNKQTNQIVSLLTSLQNTETAAEKAQLLIELEAEITTVRSSDAQLLGIIEKYMHPNITRIKANYSKESLEFMIAEELLERILAKDADCATKLDSLVTAVNLLADGALATTGEGDALQYNLVALYDLITENANSSTNNSFFGIKAGEKTISELLMALYESFRVLRYSYQIAEADLSGKSSVIAIKSALGTFDTVAGEVENARIAVLAEINELERKSISDLEETTSKSLLTFMLENQLLTEIAETDKDKDFYYTAPVDNNLAIDLGENLDGKQTLANPALNYDINNINNSFVISKIDIDYLDKGIKLARSSRLNY